MVDLNSGKARPASTSNREKAVSLLSRTRAWYQSVDARWPISRRAVELLAISFFAGYALMHGIFPRPPWQLIAFFVVIWVAIIATAITLDTSVIYRVRHLVRTVQWHTRAIDYLERRSVEGVETASSQKTSWPWGTHHTDLLGHLDAAARKWWVNYDPDSLDTAPTNEMVANWLFTERAVSKDKAKAIASILRPDGLRTGPRMSWVDPSE